MRFAVQNAQNAAAGALRELDCDKMEPSEALQGLSVAGIPNAQGSSPQKSEADRVYDGAFAQSRSVGVGSVV